MSARDRIPQIQPDNLPGPPRRRRPPDDDPAPTTPTPAAAAPATRELERAPEVPDSASKLASMLADSGKADTDDAPPGINGQAGPSVPLSALTTPPPVDPDLDLVPITVRVPRYAAEAVRLKAFLGRRRQQDVVRDALLGHDPIAPELLDECRRSAANTRR